MSAGEPKIEDGGGGFTAAHPEAEKLTARSLADIGEELIRHADEAAQRAPFDADGPYLRWRARTLRISASMVYEVVGQPSNAAKALRGT
jgi:hypothetical protein